MKITKIIGWFLLGFLLVLIFYNTKISIPTPPVIIPYSEFLDLVEQGKVSEAIIIEDNINGKIVKEAKVIPFTCQIPRFDQDLIKTLRENKVLFKAERPSGLANFINFFWATILPGIFLLFLFWFLLFRNMRGPESPFTFGRSRARIFSREEQAKVTFSDVAGVDEAKEELKEIIEFLKDPKKFQKLGARIPKGVLLVGPPGTGKTLLAKAVAGEAGVHFSSVSGSDFVEMFVGVGASRVRDLFNQSKKNAPCIIFIDELDAVGRHRGAGIGGGHDEREQTLNQLLVEMDGFNTGEGVILMAASNRPDVLDPALLRPGRFDRHIVVDAPDVVGREGILKVHAKGKVISKSVDLKVLARRTPGFVGSDLANLINEAALLSARRKKKSIGMKELEESIDRVIAGPERKSRLISEKEKKIVAYHEAGHALVAFFTPGSDPVHKISIMPRGIGSLGYTLQLPIEDKYLVTKSEILGKMSVLLGGRCSEEIIFDDVTTGAQNDLEKATEIARRMVTEYGMSGLGPITFGRGHGEIFLGRDFAREKNYSEESATKIDKEIGVIISSAHERAKALISENKEKLKTLSESLIEKEVLETEDVERILKEGNALAI
ncbi:MAG: ATP-dependent zinc metalloprotease FtsH [bacterium]|nr:ATP-dependent zinc metalloprotease FtsH [bacterium]